LKVIIKTDVANCIALIIIDCRIIF